MDYLQPHNRRRLFAVLDSPSPVADTARQALGLRYPSDSLTSCSPTLTDPTKESSGRKQNSSLQLCPLFQRRLKSVRNFAVLREQFAQPLFCSVSFHEAAVDSTSRFRLLKLVLQRVQRHCQV